LLRARGGPSLVHIPRKSGLAWDPALDPGGRNRYALPRLDQRPSRGRLTTWQTTTRPAVGRSSLSSWEASCSLSSLLRTSCTGKRAKLPRSSRQRLKPRHRRPRPSRRQPRNRRLLQRPRLSQHRPRHQRRKPLRLLHQSQPQPRRLRRRRQSSLHRHRSRHLRPTHRRRYVWAVLAGSPRRSLPGSRVEQDWGGKLGAPQGRRPRLRSNVS
jgi:hypothetical protein